MTTTTVNYTWQMPDPGASANTWGDTLNKTTQAIDAQVHTNQQGLVPIGSIVMFGGATPPTNWLLCNGQALDTTVYAQLFAVIGNAFGGVGSAGNFFLPNLQQRFPLGAEAINVLGSVGGSANYNYTIDAANLPAHTHPITDVQHNHAVTPHTHTDSGHLHQLPGSFDYGVGPVSPPSPLVSPHLSALANTAVGAAQIQPTTVSIAASGSNLSTTQPNTGGGAAMVIVPAFQAVNYIIRFQ